MNLYERNALVNVGGHSNHSSYIIKDVYEDNGKYYVHHARDNKYVEVKKNVTKGWSF